MRITPTREQMAYLASIGVAEDTLSIPVRPPATAEVSEHGAQGSQSTRSLGWVWLVILAVIFALIAGSGLARGEESPHPLPRPQVLQDDPLAGDDGAVQARLASLEQRVNALANLMEQIRRDAARHDAVVRSLDGYRKELDELQRQTQATREDLDKGTSAATRRAQDVESRLRAVDTSLATLNTRVNQATTALQMQLGAEGVEVRTLLGEEMRRQANRANQVFILFVVAGCLLTALVITGRMLMEKRMSQLETAALTQASAISADGAKAVSGNPSEKPASRPAASADAGVKPRRPVTEPLPDSPRQTMELIMRSADRIKRFRVKPRHPEGPWTMGLSTVKGNVRTENQDYGLAFRLDDGHDVLIVADGLGGVPLGQRAAHLASATAAVSVLRTYGTASLLRTPHVRDAAAKAIKDAAYRLAVEGDKRNISDSRGGLRTTLIVLIGNKREVGYAYIGDGGGCVVRASGAVERFLTPQKADNLAMNVLAASLGPTTEGEFVAGTIRRMPGDLILVGSDGVFDRVGQEFPKDVLRGCIQFKGDLQATADHVVEELAAFKDNAGYICDDNLTLGLMGDGTSPRLAQGFWSTTPPPSTSADLPVQAEEAAKEAAK